MDNEINETDVNEILNTNTEVNQIESNTVYEPTTGNVTLETIHNDLGFICTFLILGAIYVMCKLIYKGFDMFF